MGYKDLFKPTPTQRKSINAKWVGNKLIDDNGNVLQVAPSLLDASSSINGFMPITGDIQAGLLAANDLKQGDFKNAALNSVGLLPFVPALGGVIGKQAKKLTEFEKRHQTAQKNATKMLGLPPNNTAMDRAKALGFDETTYYHGTDDDFSVFSVDGKGKTTGAGAFLTSSPTAAETYMSVRGGRIMPLMAKKQNLMEVNAKGRNWNDIYTNGLTHKRKKLTEIFPNDLSPNDFTTTDEIAQLAHHGGFDGAMIKNVKDLGPNSHVFRAKEFLSKKYGIPVSEADDYWDGVTSSQFVEAREFVDKIYSGQKGNILSMQKPENIRSKFAAFDPARAHETDILGRADVGLLSTLASAGLLGKVGIDYLKDE